MNNVCPCRANRSRGRPVPARAIRMLIALPLLLCVLLGVAVSLPLWLASRFVGRIPLKS